MSESFGRGGDARLWACRATASIRASARSACLTGPRGEAQSRGSDGPCVQEEIAMKTDITSASTALPSRFPKTLVR